MTMKNSRKFDFRTAYIDILIALLMGTVVIFMLTTLLANMSVGLGIALYTNAVGILASLVTKGLLYAVTYDEP